MARTKRYADPLMEAQVKRREETGLLFAGAAILCAVGTLATPLIPGDASYYPGGALTLSFLVAGGYLNIKEIKALRGLSRNDQETP